MSGVRKEKKGKREIEKKGEGLGGVEAREGEESTMLGKGGTTNQEYDGVLAKTCIHQTYPLLLSAVRLKWSLRMDPSLCKPSLSTR